MTPEHIQETTDRERDAALEVLQTVHAGDYVGVYYAAFSGAAGLIEMDWPEYDAAWFRGRALALAQTLESWDV